MAYSAKPYGRPDQEHRTFKDALDQSELAEQLGFDYRAARCLFATRAAPVAAMRVAVAAMKAAMAALVGV